MLRRKILDKLEMWYQSGRYKAPLIFGARQVGKTTAVREFARSHYNHFVEVNFVKYPIALQAFDGELTTHTIVSNLSAMGFGPFVEGSTLVFFDEIQECPKARTAIKFLVEEHRYDFIESGSLLGINYKSVKSYPVGYEERYDVFPLDFEEFLWAKGVSNEVISIVKNAYSSLTAVPDFIHEQLSRYYREYLVVGGMPEAVQKYALTGDVIALEDTYETLVQAYKDDSEKYVKGNKLTDVVRFVLTYGWAFAGETITLGNFANSGYKSREVAEAFRLLEKAMLLELVYPVSSTQMPAIPETRRTPKLVWFDTGLVNYQAGIRKEIIGSTEMVDSWRGHIAEQIVAQELIALDDRVSSRHSFWARPNNGAEVDFIITHNSKIYPIEVKSGANAHLRSLQVFMDNSDIDIAIRVWSKPFSIDRATTPQGKEFKLINLPFYLISSISSIIDSLL